MGVRTEHVWYEVQCPQCPYHKREDTWNYHSDETTFIARYEERWVKIKCPRCRIPLIYQKHHDVYTRFVSPSESLDEHNGA